MKPKLYLDGPNLGPVRIVETVRRMDLKLKRHSRALGLGYEANVRLVGSDAGGLRIEGSKVFEYPTTFEIKIESHSNHFFSVRLVDDVWIREGRTLDGAGLTAGAVFRSILRELKRHAELIAEHKGAV